MADIDKCVSDVASELGMSERDAQAIADKLEKFKKSIQAETTLANIDDEIRKQASGQANASKASGQANASQIAAAQIARHAAGLANASKIAAAQKLKHAALNVIARQRLARHVDTLMAGGMSERKAIQSYLVGSVKGMALSRKSVHARRIALEDEWLDGMYREMKRHRPHLAKLVASGDQQIADDLVAEMVEIKPNGNRGVTGNKDAEYLAGLLSKYLEISRRRMNDAGAFIGKLHGYIPTHHDDVKVGRVTADEWKARILPLLDVVRTFDQASQAEINKALDHIYENIVTGMGTMPSGKAQTGRSGPANLADNLAKHRVLHFKDADSWRAYQADFGRGDPFSAVADHLHRAARTTSLMEALGPNPEHLLTSFIEQRKLEIRKSNLTTAEKKARIEALKVDLTNPISSRIANAFAQVTGDTLSPGSSVWAKRTQAVRSIKSMAILGAATLTAVPTDIASMAASFRFRGDNSVKALARAIKAGFRGRSSVERTEVAELVQTGFDQMFGALSARYLADDLLPGKTATAVETFFRWTGMTPWTESRRSAFQVMTARDFADNAKIGWKKLNSRFKNLLEQHGISEQNWNVYRTMTMTDETGASFLIPERARKLTDAQVDILIADDLASVRQKLKGDVLAKREHQLRERGRRDAETAARSFLTDEANFGVLDIEDADRMVSNAGTKPGTFLGEFVRFAMQLKGFPIAFTRKVLGRAIVGGKKKNRSRFVNADAGQIAFLIGSMTIAGYISMLLKDTSKLRSPRDPTRPATWMAALLQGGAMGIYGDFLFSKSSRFGNSSLETMAGPVASDAASVVNLLQGLRDGETRASSWFRLLIHNTPFINMFYIRGALDYLVLRHIEDWISPGTTARRKRRLREQFGQEML